MTMIEEDVQESGCPGMVATNNDGFAFQLDDKKKFRRFIVLGSETACYYSSSKEIAIDNITSIRNLIQNGRGMEVLDELTDYSVNGKVPKQDTILLAYAYICRQDDVPLKREAYKRLNSICRIPTHLFTFLSHCEKMSKGASGKGTGWGRAHRRAVSNWYMREDYRKKPRNLALAVTKYQQREGWSHKDALRLAHPPADKTEGAEGVAFILRYIVKGLEAAEKKFTKEQEASQGILDLMDYLRAIEKVKTLGKDQTEEVVDLIIKHRLVREHLPTTVLGEAIIWETMINDMPVTAMIRNLGKMTSVGVLQDNKDCIKSVVDKLNNLELLKKAKVHPFNILVALSTYKQGHGDLGKLTWSPNSDIKDALDNAFYLSFQCVEPTGKRYCLAVDVSGSMCCPILGSTSLWCRDGSAAMAMVTARTEKDHEFVGFTGKLLPLKIKASMKLDEVIDVVSGLPFGGTNCALPMQWAMQNQKKFDVFVVYTDSETSYTGIHPHQALEAYRKQSGIEDARLIGVGMAANKFSIADPSDPGMMDVVGFDSGAPAMMNRFIAGEV